MNKELKPYRQKMNTDELQMYLHFRRRGGKVPAKKGKGTYDRKSFQEGGYIE
ncbi:MAG: hypothetical protein LIR50_21375 [Bacillota bacterium]|nr:hypothetical protein [Bacillota bacterium]